MVPSVVNAVFPKTLELLREKRLEYLREQFGQSLQDEMLLAASCDTSRWFPAFLKVQGIRQEILEVAEFEYLNHAVRTSDLGAVRGDQGQILLNPTLQFVELHFEQPRLGRGKGLYCFFKKQGRVFEEKLGISQALIIDLLQGERKYNVTQIIDSAVDHKLGRSLSREQWQRNVSDLLNSGLLIILN